MPKPTKIIKSVISELREENKSNEEFEIMLNKLTLEELISLKLELSAKISKTNKLYGLPIWQTLPEIIRYSIFKFALGATTSQSEAGSFLGMSRFDVHQLIKKYNLKKDE